MYIIIFIVLFIMIILFSLCGILFTIKLTIELVFSIFQSQRRNPTSFQSFCNFAVRYKSSTVWTLVKICHENSDSLGFIIYSIDRQSCGIINFVYLYILEPLIIFKLLVQKKYECPVQLTSTHKQLILISACNKPFCYI